MHLKYKFLEIYEVVSFQSETIAKVLMMEVRDIFLDICKAFDKVWYEGLVYKLRRNVIHDNLLQLLLSFLDGRKQRFMLCWTADDTRYH